MTSASFETILLEIEDGIATITLNRPDKLNAFTTQMMADLIAAFDATAAAESGKAVIVTGAGRGFCAGADLSAGANTFDRDARPDPIRQAARVGGVERDGGGRLTLRIFDSLKPVIAAVNGPAVGVGVTMQLAMDMRMASTEARFGFVFARRGITPEAASSWFLPAGRSADGAGVVLHRPCFPRQGGVGQRPGALSPRARGILIPAARALAREIIDNTAPVSVALTRQMLWRMAGAEHPMIAHRADSRGIQSRGRSGDTREGVAAFLEKRPAVWPNHVSTDLPELFPDWAPPDFR